MANWVYIEAGEIKEYRDTLPKSWKNISGLDKASLSQLKTLGWLPVEDIPVTVDQDNFEVDGIDYTIESDKVKQRVRVKPLPNPKKAERQENKKNEFFKALRQERNRRLTECDWTQLADVQGLRNKSWRDGWNQYRQALRDLPQTYRDTTTFDLSSVEWPASPESVER